MKAKAYAIEGHLAAILLVALLAATPGAVRADAEQDHLPHH